MESLIKSLEWGTYQSSFERYVRSGHGKANGCGEGKGESEGHGYGDYSGRSDSYSYENSTGNPFITNWYGCTDEDGHSYAEGF
jgi:hypothetical protein